MTTLFEKFVEEIETVVTEDFAEAANEICEESFYNNAECYCLYDGSDDCYDSGAEQWYPGDDAEYEVSGYDEYLDEVADGIADLICGYYGVDLSNELVKDIRDNISSLTGEIDVLDFDAFREKAIEHFEG